MGPSSGVGAEANLDSCSAGDHRARPLGHDLFLGPPKLAADAKPAALTLPDFG